MNCPSPIRWFPKLMLGLAVAGLLACGSARAAIALHDGTTTAITTDSDYFANVGTNVITANFTVTAGANVLVISTFDQNNQNYDSPPTVSAWQGQPLAQCDGEVSARSLYASSDIWFLYNPPPGTQTITVTDNSGSTPSSMAMQVYTLSGVDTNYNGAFPLYFLSSAAYGTNGTVALSGVSGQEVGGW